jgi:hypothetical protein
VAVLIVAVVLLWNYGMNSQEGRDAADARTAQPRTSVPRILWTDAAAKPPLEGLETRLSPIERPKEPEPPPPEVKVVPPPPKTDDQLRDELEAALNSRFTVQRVMLSSSDDYATIANVVAGNVHMQWFEGMNLEEEYLAAKSAALRKLALDLKVLRIDAQGVLVDAASFETPEKRFEIVLRLASGATGSLIDVQKFGSFDPERDKLLAVNGTPVTSMAELRRVVQEQYATGTREFAITYERDGVPGTCVVKLDSTKAASSDRAVPYDPDSAAEKARQWGYPLPRD